MGAGSKTGSVARKNGNRAKVGLLSSLAIVAILAIPATALAAKGGGSTGSPAWIALGSVNGTSAPSTRPMLGNSVTFAAGYPSTTKNPWVSVMCYQGSTLVYGEGGGPTAAFVLGGASSLWLSVGGSATCTAELGDLYWRGGHQYYTYLATTSFGAN